VAICAQAHAAGEIQFHLVDANLNKVIVTNIQPGATVTISDALIKAKNLSIEARMSNTATKLKTMQIVLDTASKSESVAPYYIFGDSEGDVTGRAIAVGTHKLSATATPVSGTKVTVALSFNLASDASTAPKDCSNGMKHGEQKFVNRWPVANVAYGLSCPAPTSHLLMSCTDGVVKSETNLPGFESCVVLPETQPDPETQPGPEPVAGCPCANRELSAGRIPTLGDVGACGSMQKTYADDLVIDEAFIRARGSRVVHSIEVKGGLTVTANDVTVCNFKADSLQLGDRTTVKHYRSGKLMGSKQYMFPTKNVVVQDGTLNSTTAGVLVNFKPNSSGLVRRIAAFGGTSDGIRVGPTLPGYRQEVSQSYIVDVGLKRGETAHADLVQSYPVPYVDTPNDVIVVTEKMMRDGFDATKSDDVDELGSTFAIGNYKFHDSLIRQNYLQSALYSGAKNHAGLAVNATWMAMTSGAKFEGNQVARVYRGFWIEPERALFGENIRIVDNLFTGKMDKYMALSCKTVNGKIVNSIEKGFVQHDNFDSYRNETVAAACQN
jgi:hypothetical protein